MERSSIARRAALLVPFVVVWVVLLVRRDPLPLILWLMLAVGAFSILLVVVRMRTMHRGNDAPSTGNIVPPHGGPLRELPATWIGGGNLPGSFGRMSATTPLVVLELSPGALAVRVRPRLLGTFFGASRFEAVPSQVAAVLPVRAGSERLSRTGVLGSPGIGILPANGDPIVYFWCDRPDRSEILALAARAGFDVSWEERSARIW